MTDTLLNKLGFEPTLKPGYKVHILPDRNFGWYELPIDQVPEIIPRQIVNIASASQPLPALNPASVSPLRKEIRELDMDNFELAQFRVVVLDDINATIFQPATVGRFGNKKGPLVVRKGETDLNYIDKDSLLPELYIFGDDTRPTVEVTNNQYVDTMNARLVFFGYRYPLQKIEPPMDTERMPAFTLTVNGQAAQQSG